MARNLLLGTGIAIESEGRIVGSKYQYFTDKFVIPKTGLKGKWVTISFDYEVRGAYGSADIGQARIGFAGAVKRASGASAYHEKWFYPSKDESNPSTEKGRMYLTANLSSYTEEELQTLSCGLYIQRIAGGYARVSNLLFVIGNAQDPWQPAPEDITYNIPQDIELGSLKLTAGEPFQKADDTYRIRSASPVDAYSTDFMMAVPDGYELIVNDYGSDGTLIGGSMSWLVPESGYVSRKLTPGTTQIGYIFKRSDNGEITDDDIKIISGGGTSNMIKARQSIEVVSPEPIGGRNLAINSGRPGRDMSQPIGVDYNKSKYNIVKFDTSQKFEANVPYSVTLKINNLSAGRTWIGAWRNPGNLAMTGGVYLPIKQGEQVISWTGYWPSDPPEGKNQLLIYAGPASAPTWQAEGDLEIEWVKLEKGNQPTDWTPAPEDVEQGITDAITEVSKKYDASLVVLSDSITGTVAEKETKLQNDIKTVTDTVSRLTQKADGIQADFTKLTNTVNENDQQTTGQINEIKKYIRFDADGITLGQSDNQLKVQITNERLSFLQGDIEVAYFSNNRMHITDADIDNSIRLGHFAFIPRDDGSLDFKKVA